MAAKDAAIDQTTCCLGDVLAVLSEAKLGLNQAAFGDSTVGSLSILAINLDLKSGLSVGVPRITSPIKW